MNKRNLILWSLYDFANSIVFITFLLYFSQWLVIDGGLPDLWYNATFPISTLLLLLSAPALAARQDRKGGRKRSLAFLTACTAISYSLAATFAQLGAHIVIITICFTLGQYFYQLSFIPYNPMLEQIADRAHRSRASGIGQFFNALGQAFGLLITLPLSQTRLRPLLPSVGLFVVLALPMLILYREDNPYSTHNPEPRDRPTPSFLKRLISFFAVSASAPLLLAFFLYNDALVTVTNNYSIYMERVFRLPDSQKSILLLLIVIMNGAGAITAGWVGDRIGILKTLKLVLLAWVICLPIISLTVTPILFSAMTLCVGLLIGAMWATSRAYMSTLLQPHEIGYGFSFYTLLERFASLVGPLAWGAIIATQGTRSSSYRVAMASMTIFVLAGLLVVIFWRRGLSLTVTVEKGLIA
jgi:MFS transporter, UMF1 family